MSNPNEPDDLTLANLAGGAAVELFEMELVRILENILDQNTKATAKRKIKLEVTFVPSPDRNQVATLVDCTSKPAPVDGAVATVFVGMTKSGIPRAVTYDPRQLQMEFDEDGVAKPRVLPDSRKDAAGA